MKKIAKMNNLPFVPTYVRVAQKLDCGNIKNGMFLDKFKQASAETFSNVIAATKKESTGVFVSEHEYGEAISLVSDAADVSDITVAGYDYMGQPMKEVITLTGTTAAAGGKAFKFITSLSRSGATNNVTMATIGKVGVKYASTKIDHVISNGLNVATTNLFVAAPSIAQTATTADPRGLFVFPAAGSDGDEIEVMFVVTDYVIAGATPAADNGGVYGMKHFS